MESKDFFLVLGTVALAIALVVLPGAAKAGMYVEGYVGGVFGSNTSMTAGSGGVSTPTVAPFGGPHFIFVPPGTANSFLAPNAVSSFASKIRGSFDPNVIGGLKVGTWFVKEGFLKYDYPTWMKYLGFYLDFSYSRLNFTETKNGTRVVYNETGSGGPVFAGTTTSSFFSEGVAPTLAFMFTGRYGFLQDDEVPFGRLQPYIGVGPAILFASQKPKIIYSPHTTLATDGTGRTLTNPNFTGVAPGDSGSTAIALAVDAGVRYMMLKDVSLDVSFKYRYAQPSFHYSFTDPFSGNPNSFTLKPTYNLFSGQVGVAYHF